MKVIIIIDNYIDDREFRNYSSYLLTELGYSNVVIEDPRLKDDDPTNDNDIFASKDGIKYTVQTFLNKELTDEEFNETLEDMKKEKLDNAIIITNKGVSNNFKKYAKENSIEIIDRRSFKEEL